MEAAAKKVELLSQRILPELPHQLSYSAHWRYRPPAEDDPRSHRFEEWHNTRLQYLTLVSEADRGVLMTRSYYDMREEPAKPVHKEISALAKSGVEKKRLSLSDYKNKKTTGTISASPPEPAIAKRKESERASLAAAAAAPTPPPTAAEDSGATRKSSGEMKKADRPRPRESDSAIDGKPRQPRDTAVDMSLPPKPPASLPPRPPSPSGKKRTADLDEEPRPQKRSKPDSGRPADSRPSNPRDDALRRKDRPPSSTRDTPPASALPNGRAMLKGAASLNRNGSPLSRPRGDSVNGVRPAAAGSNKTTPTKLEVSSKTSVPPLLSPLHLSFDGNSRKRDDESDHRQDRRRREDGDGARSPKAKNKEAPPGTRKDMSSLALPPLLSPTLPPAVEAALSRPLKPSPDSIDDGDSGSGTKKKAAVESPDEEAPRKPTKKRMIVTMRIPKKLRQTVRRILALSAGQSKGRETQDRERQPSDESIQPSQAKKRPPPAVEKPLESMASKKPRTSEVTSSSRLPAPATPSKKGTTAMSRVSSSNSLAQTPGEQQASTTPSATGSVDRRTNGQPIAKADSPELKTMRDRETRMSRLARDLKHKADLSMKDVRSSPNAGSSASRARPSSVKRGYVLHLESIIAFMLGFQAQNLHRGMCNKRYDPTGWASMFPLMEFLQKDMRRQDAGTYRPLYALLLLLHVVSIDELIKCYGNLENPGGHVTLQDLIRHERTRTKLVPHIRETNDGIENTSMRANVALLATLDEISETALRILRRWCADEHIDWVPEVNMKDAAARSGSG